MWKAVIGGTALLWVAAAAALLESFALHSDFLHDDAYITLRYAQNLLAGNGIGWNPGDRVEGYTNFLQLLGVSALGTLGVDLVAATRVLAAAAYAALFAFLALWLPRRLEGVRSGPAGALLVSLPLAFVATSTPLWVWGFGGLEAPLLCTLVTLGIAWLYDALEAESPSPRVLVASGLALALACLTRLDAGLFVATGAVFLLRGGRREGVRAAAWFALPVVALLTPWLGWKLAYYGSLLPNTFFVKATDPSVARLLMGLRYVVGYLLAPPFGALLLAGGILRAAWRPGGLGGLGAGSAFALAAVVLQLAWVVFVGGDQMPMQRLLVPVIPTILWLSLVLWLPDLERLRAPALALVAVAATALVALPLATQRTRTLNSTAFVGAAVGRHIGAHWPAGSLVALNTAGSTPYYAPGHRYVDMLGLNDAHIARREVGPFRIPGQSLPGHAKGDGEYVLSQIPDYIILGPAHGVPASRPWFLSDLEITEDERFARSYRFRQERLDVSDQPGWREFAETRTGALLFSWYERIR